MKKDLKRILGEGPFPFSDNDENNPQVHIYHGAGAVIIKPVNVMHLPMGIHAHNSYEFVIPMSDMPTSYVGNKLIHFEKNRLLPINANQEHGPSMPMDNCNVLGLLIDHSVFSNIAYTICDKKEVEFINEFVEPNNELLRYMRQYMEEASLKQAGYEFMTHTIVNQIVIILLRQLRSNISHNIIERNYHEKDGINRAISFLKENYHRDYSLESVAQTANLSPYHFIRVFKLTTGKTPYDYLLDIKIDKACHLLRSSKISVTEACFICGFNNLEHFSSVFKRKTGMLPSQYKRICN